jgi:hypothetical protein
LTNLALNDAASLTNFPALLLRTNGSAAGLTNFPASVLLTNGSAAGLTNFPTLNQNTTGTASNVTGVVAVANGGTGATNAASGATALELGATNNVTFNNLTTSGTLTATGNVTMNGVGNTAPSQAASSGASLMTRDLVDAAYTRTFNKYAVYESYNFTTNMLTAIGGSASPSITTGGVDAPAWAYRPNSTNNGANNYQALLGPYATLSTGIRSQKNWSKKTTLGARIMHISSDGTSRYYYGPVASSWAGGDLAVKGIGFEIVTNSIFAVCHNGTNKTTSASGVALTNLHIYNVVSESDGAGNVKWYVNGAEQTALTNGPSGLSASSAYGFVTEAVNPTPAAGTFIHIQALQLISEL